MTFVNLVCSGKLVRSVNSHSVLFSCLLDFDNVFSFFFFKFFQFTLRSMIDAMAFSFSDSPLFDGCGWIVWGIFDIHFPPISTNFEVDNKMCWGKRSKTTQQREYLYKK